MGKHLETPLNAQKEKEIEGQAILTSELPTMDTQKKRWKSEVNTKTPKTKEQRQSQQPKKRGGGKGGEIRNLQQITKEKKKEREKRDIPQKSAAQIGRGKSPKQSWNSCKNKQRRRDSEQWIRKLGKVKGEIKGEESLKTEA